MLDTDLGTYRGKRQRADVVRVLVGVDSSARPVDPGGNGWHEAGAQRAWRSRANHLCAPAVPKRAGARHAPARHRHVFCVMAIGRRNGQLTIENGSERATRC